MPKIECSLGFLFFNYRFVFFDYIYRYPKQKSKNRELQRALHFCRIWRSIGQQCMMSSSQWYNYSEVCSRVLQEVQQQPSGLLSPDEGGLQLEKPDSPSAQAEGEKKDDLNTVSLSGVRRKLYVVMVVIVSELQEWSALDNTVKDIQASVEELAAGGDEEGGEDGKEEAAKKTHGLDSESESEEDEEGEG